MRSSARVSPDRPAVAITFIVVVAAIVLASYWYSFMALADAGSWTGAGATRYAVPIFIDLFIVGGTLSLALGRWRGEPVRQTMFWLVFFTVISIAVNIAHAGSYQQWDFSRIEAWFAVLIAGVAPIAALAGTNELTKRVLTQVHEPESAPEPVEVVEQVEAAPIPVVAPEVEPSTPVEAPEITEVVEQPAPQPAPVADPAPVEQPVAEPVVLVAPAPTPPTAVPVLAPTPVPTTATAPTVVVPVAPPTPPAPVLVPARY